MEIKLTIDATPATVSLAEALQAFGQGLSAYAKTLSAATERTSQPFPFDLPEDEPAAEEAQSTRSEDSAPAERVDAAKAEPAVPAQIAPEDQPNTGAEADKPAPVETVKAEQAQTMRASSPLQIAQAASEILSEFGYMRPYNAEAKDILKRTRQHFGLESFGAITAEQTPEALDLIRKLAAEARRHG